MTCTDTTVAPPSVHITAQSPANIPATKAIVILEVPAAGSDGDQVKVLYLHLNVYLTKLGLTVGPVAQSV
jgi:hypothetical protein